MYVVASIQEYMNVASLLADRLDMHVLAETSLNDDNVRLVHEVVCCHHLQMIDAVAFWMVVATES